MSTEYNQYTLPATLSFIAHALLLIVLLYGIQLPNKPPVLSQAPKTIEAVTVDQKQVEQEVARLQKEKQKEEETAVAQKNKLQKQLADYLKQQKQEQAKLEKIREDLKQQQQQRVVEQKAAAQKLAELKNQQLQEQQRLEKIKQEQVAAKLKEQREQEQAKKVAAKKVQEVEKAKATTDKAKQKNEKQLAEQKRKQEIEQALKEAEMEEAEREAAAAKKKSLTKKTAQQATTKDKPAVNSALSAQMQGEVDKYKSLILHAIGQRWLIPENTDKNLSCKLWIRVAPGGTVLDAKIVQSSGDPLLDRSALNAVHKASPLPVPDAPELFDRFREFNLTVRPEGLLSAV